MSKDIKVGTNIKMMREFLNLTQCELATILNVSDKTVSSWEINRTEPKMGMIHELCKVFNCKVSDLIGESMIHIVPDETIALYNKLDELDKAEIRGTIKQMLKSEKYDIKKESNSG